MQASIPTWKRVFDVTIALSVLLVLSPLFLLVALAIRLESKGPVFYYSPRVGMHYKIFPFFKFRSMYVNADKMVKDMSDLSQYQQPSNKEEFNNGKIIPPDEEIRVSDNETMTESEFQTKRKEGIHNAFFKVKNDPRITKVGKFIRRTSIDELPQLINVLRGEMSIVGNRPLPLYEAEKITEDYAIQRFSAPAGITGFWQVTDRGRDDVSVDGRKSKDVYYARKFNLWFDLWILFRTPLAAIQKVSS